MSVVRFAVPDLGQGVAEARIVKWCVAEGDSIVEDGPMVEVSTDKADVEIPSPASGTVSSLCVDAGSTVTVGTVIIEITTA